MKPHTKVLGVFEETEDSKLPYMQKLPMQDFSYSSQIFKHPPYIEAC